MPFAVLSEGKNDREENIVNGLRFRNGTHFFRLLGRIPKGQAPRTSSRPFSMFVTFTIRALEDMRPI